MVDSYGVVGTVMGIVMGVSVVFMIISGVRTAGVMTPWGALVEFSFLLIAFNTYS